jgi:hypothetical protein
LSSGSKLRHLHADRLATLAASLLVLIASPVQAAIATQAPRSSTEVRAGKSVPAAFAICGQDVPVTDAACRKEFEHWQAQEKRWRDNHRLYANYVTYQGAPVRQVRRPDPPLWIAPYCEQQSILNVTPPSLVCQAYDDYLRYDWTEHVEGPQAAVTFSKRVSQPGPGEANGFVDYLIKNLHFDGAWTTSEKGPRFYGLLGTHLTLAHAGRLYLWGPPGMLVLRRPEGRIEVKMTWGIDLFVADVPVPGTTSFRLPLYFSIAKVFGKTEQAAIQENVNVGLNMVGFSVTFKR